jgi:hypothetical protein
MSEMCGGYSKTLDLLGEDLDANGLDESQEADLHTAMSKAGWIEPASEEGGGLDNMAAATTVDDGFNARSRHLEGSMEAGTGPEPLTRRDRADIVAATKACQHR